MVLAAAERRLQLAERLAAVILDPRDPHRVTDGMADIVRARIFAIACGYEDANDLDRQRTDPAFKLACGRPPDAGLDLCSQPTLSRVQPTTARMLGVACSTVGLVLRRIGLNKLAWLEPVETGGSLRARVSARVSR